MNAHAATLQNRVICACFDVTERQIRDHFASDMASFEAFVDQTSATTKCTACKLDFDLVIESIRSGKEAGHRRADYVRPIPTGRIVHEHVDSGFLVNREGIRTLIRVDNRPNPFDPQSQHGLADFRWEIRAIGEDGRRCFTKRGQLDIGQTISIALGEHDGCPEVGWFWIWLYPKRAGYFGATRPQYALIGPGWAATVHTQPHALACCRKSVVIQAQRGGFRSLASVINGSNSKPAKCEIVLSSEGHDHRSEATIPANGSRMLDIDEMFPGLGFKISSAFLTVKSDQPVRKHIIKIQPSGHYSIDHFPDAK